MSRIARIGLRAGVREPESERASEASSEGRRRYIQIGSFSYLIVTCVDRLQQQLHASMARQNTATIAAAVAADSALARSVRMQGEYCRDQSRLARSFV